MKQRIGSSLVVVALWFLAVSVENLAQAFFAGDELVHIAGADENGTVYEVKHEPALYRAALDGQGEYRVPSYISKTVMLGQQKCSVTSQVPVAGARFFGPQQIEVQLQYAGGSQTYWARMPIDIVDETAPAMDVQLLGNGLQPRMSPGGIPYFQPPVNIHASVVSSDNVDGRLEAPDPSISIEIGCEVVIDVFEVTEPGYYRLNVSATDSSGNKTYSTQLFEVRAVKNVEGAAAIESLTITPNGATDFVEATVVLTSGEVDPCMVNLATFALWLYDEAISGSQSRHTPQATTFSWLTSMLTIPSVMPERSMRLVRSRRSCTSGSASIMSCLEQTIQQGLRRS